MTEGFHKVRKNKKIIYLFIQFAPQLFVGLWYMSPHTTPLLQCNQKLHFVHYTQVFLWQVLDPPLMIDARKRCNGS